MREPGIVTINTLLVKMQQYPKYITEFRRKKNTQHNTFISSAPLIPSLCSTLHRSLQIRSFASGDSLASSGNFKVVLQFTICILKLRWNITITDLDQK